MDREAIVREVRRRQVQETLDFEREREQTLMEQIELVITEADGKSVDEAVYAQMSPEDVQIVKQELTPTYPEDDDPAFFFERDDLIDLDEEEVDPHTEELNRLNAELADCRRRQRAFEAYLAGLGNGITTD